MDKKYQIFVSSTYEDLKLEREAVTRAILEVGDIPVGMEMFSAADETQWKLIKRQIDQSDYYIVLIAHRYGSTVDGVSYTELEYDYAVKQGVPALGFLLEKEVEWPPSRIDSDPQLRAKLDAFRSKVKSRMVSFWTTADSLTSKVLAALSKQKNLNPMPGWVRANNVPGPEVLSELARLGQEVSRLSEDNSLLRQNASQNHTFELIDAMADDIECQALILMYETNKDIPRNTRYVYNSGNGLRGSGSFSGAYGRDRLQSAGLIRPSGGGQFMSLTPLGIEFSVWLLNKGRKCKFIWTPVGGWGDPDAETLEEKWLAEAQSDSRANPTLFAGAPDDRPSSKP